MSASGGPRDLPPLPRPERLPRIFLAAIAIGSTTAAIGAWYITLTATFQPGQLGPFLAALAALVAASIVVIGAVHFRLASPLRGWLKECRPDEPPSSDAWRAALNYPYQLATAVLLAALGVSSGASLIGAWQAGAGFAERVATGGLLASVMDATFVFLYAESAFGPIRESLSARDPTLPVKGPGIVSLGAGRKMTAVVTAVVTSSAVLVGTLSYRGAERMLEAGYPDLGWLAPRLLAAGAVGLALSLAGSLMVIRQTARPARELDQMLTGLTTLEKRFRVSGTDEVADLGRTVNLMLAGLQERERLKDAFGRYMARQVSEVVLKEKLELGGEMLEVTVLMSDIRGFTTLAEQLSPQEIVQLLNVYFTAWVDVVVRHDGMVDKFIGDAIMVVFGAPLPMPPEESALRAARCALEMRGRMAEMNRTLTDHGLPAIEMGVGLHTGEAVVGNVGSTERMDYTCIGDVVNTATRIESGCKEVGAPVLISAHVRGLLGSRVEVGEGQRLTVKGKRRPVDVYPLVGVQ